MFSIFKKKKVKIPFTPKLPLTWWVDDLSHRVCGLVDCPEFGLSNMPWPDCEKVYLAVDKAAYDELEEKINTIGTLLEENLSILRENETIYHLTKEVLDICTKTNSCQHSTCEEEK